MKFIIDFRFGFIKFLGSLFILFLGMGPLPCFGQVIIPIREGFPYCEPFTGTGADVRANTVFGGQRFVGGVPIDIEPTLTGESLQLTTNGNNENGYVFVDIPFPSFYGLKVSFEYSSYGRSSDIGADGFSFFMFDGSINESTFEIGGAGGALGYTARQPEPGLKGAYIGIGFDEFGNFGNYFENKRYSFLSTTVPPVTEFGLAGDPSTSPENFYSHSVVVRGPVAPGDNVRNKADLFDSYEFISGKLLNNDFGDFPGVAEEFYLPDAFDRLRVDIDSPSRVFDCDDEGYRKVFIDLQPQPGGYRISVWILAYVNGQRQVFPVIDSEYNFPPPPFLKVGFAASTGGRNNFHEIKNVTVEVSDESQLNPPIIQAQNREVCEGEQLDFEFPVELLNAGSFVRCVQLFETEQEALDSRPEETPPGQIPGTGDCGLSGNCQLELCQIERTVLATEFGTFETFLIEESNGDFSQGIDFESNTSTSGEVTVYYTVVDNFGQVSLPKPITIVVNPLPQPEITTDDPLIWEEFEVNDIYVRLEANPTGAGFQYQWYKDGSLIPGATNDFFLAEGAAALGNYTVEIIDEKGCFGASAEEVKISLVEDLVPDILNGVFRETCAAEGSITVSFDASSVLGDEKWRIVDEEGAQVYPAGDGWNSIASGTESVTQSNLLVGNYTFQIGDSFREGQLGSDGIPLFRHQIPFTIDPIEFPLAISVTSQDELCFAEGGSINVVAQDGNETYTYELWQNGNLISSSAPEITVTTFQFSGVQVGSYEIRVGSGSRCEEFDNALIAGPTPITIQVIDFKDVTCEVNDASIEWAATGGTGNFTFVSITRNGVELGINEFALTQNGNQFLFEDLSIGNYSLTIRDQNGCEVESTSSQQINEIPKPKITISNSDDYCEGEVIILTSNLVVSGNLVDPEYTWITDFGDRITGTTTISGITYTFLDHDANTFTPPHLLISGLIAGDYEFSLELRGENSCDTDVSTDFTVNPIPVPTIVRAAAAVCFGSSDGVIEVGVGSGQTSEYEFMLDGITPYQNNPVFEVGISAGTYTVFVRNKISGCEESITTTISEPAELLATVNTSVDPTCGEENGLFTFNVAGGSPFSSGEPYSITINGEDFFGMANGSQDPGNIFSLSQLANGLYEISISDANGCVLALVVNLTAQEIPQFEVENVIVCEEQPAIIIAETILLAGASPVFEWYRENPSGSGDLIQILNGEQIDGVSFLINNKELIIDGLLAREDPYLFYLAISGDKVCPAEEIPVEVIVNPIPLAEFEVVDLLCHGGNIGEIRIVSSEAEYTYSLLETGETSLDGNFSGLPAGEYTIRADNTEGCFNTFVFTITQPEELELINPNFTNPTCGEANGQIAFEIIGGTSDYQILINGNLISTYTFAQAGQVFEVSDLVPGTYAVEVTDAQGCIVSLPSDFVLMDDQGVQVNLNPIDVEFCFNETAVLVPVFNPALPASIELIWYKDQATTDQIVSSPNPDPSNVIYQINNLGALNIQNLPAGQYTYYLEISGPEVCTRIEEVQLQIFPEVVATFDIENVSCFGGNNGSITLTSADPAGSITYTIVETGDNNTTGIFNDLIAGTYTITAQEDGSPCTYDFSLTIAQPEELIIYNPLGTNPTCGDSNGSIQFDLNGGTPDYVISVNGNQLSGYSASINGATVELKNLPPGTYSVTVTDANDCEVTAPNLLTLVNDDGVVLDMNPLDEVICVGGDAVLLPTYSTTLPVVPTLKWYKDAALTQSITNGPDAAGVSYQINPTNGELTIQGLQLGDFTYYVEISGPGICSKVESATVEVIPEITATINTEDIICFGDTNGSIEITPTGGNGIFEISINGSPFSNQTSYLDLAAGSFTVSIRNDVGCLTEIDVEILGPSEPIAINDPTVIRASCGLDNGSISDLVITGGWGNYNVEWRKGSVTGPVVSGGLTGASNLSPDTYFLLVTDSEACTAEFSFVIGQSSDPVYAVVPPINACTANPVEIRPIHIAPDPSLPPAAASEVRWYFGPNQSGLIQNGPDSSIPGVIYTIDDSDWLNPELLIEGLPSGTYNYYFYVVCTGQEIEIEVIAFDTPEVELETDAIACFGNTNGKVRVISGADPSYTYSVNGAAPVSLAALESQTFTAGTYNLVIATPAGCAQDLTFDIEGPSAPLASSPLTKIDPGCGAPNGKLILTVTGGWAPYSLEVFKNGVSEDIISTSEFNITLDGYTTGVYKIEITDAEGCIIATNEVTLVDGPTQVLVTDDTICEGEVATLTPTLDPVASGSTFQWFFDQALTQPITNSPNPAADGRIYQINSGTGVLTIAGLAQTATPFSYYVTASGATICPGFIGEGNVIVGGTPTATAVVVDEVCFGDGGTITVNASGGSGNYTYSLNGGAFGSSNIFDVAPGIYSIEVRNQEGCSITLDDLEVIGPVSALIVNSLVQDNASCGLDNGEIRFAIDGGYTPYNVSYSKNGTTSGTTTSSDGQVRVSNLGLGSYAFTITDAQGCELILNSPVTITEVPTTITANGDQICEGETAELLATVPQNIPDPQFTWSFDAQGNNPIISGDVNGITYAVGPDGRLDITGLLGSGSPYTYYVTAAGTGICGLTPKPVTVTMSPVANLKVSNPSVVCDPNGRVDLTDYIEGFNSTVYDYNVLSPSGSAMLINEIENVALSGDYRVSSSVKGSNCWNQPQRIRVLIAETELIANFQYEIDLGGGNLVTNGDVQIEEDVQFQDLTQGNAILWNWDFGDGSTSAEQSPVHQFLEKGTYTVILSTIDDIGCQSEFQIIVNVFDDYMVMVPNAFTPGGAKNQFFKPQFRGIASMEFYIFNTWGELIYQTNSLEDKGWDGTLNGQPTPNGNYVFRAVFKTRAGETVEKAGVFILIR